MTKCNCCNAEPTYLSTSDGKWRVIHHGLPICADTDIATARRAAASFKLTLPPCHWDGERGEFITTTPANGRDVVYRIGFGDKHADGTVVWHLVGPRDAIIGEIVGREMAQRVVDALNAQEAA